MKTPAFSLLSKLLLVFITLYTLSGCKKPDVTFSVSPEGPVLMGESVTLDWNVSTLSFATSFAVSIESDTGIEIGPVTKVGTQEVVVTENTQFTLTATQVVLGQTYTATVPVSIEVTPIDPPVIVDFSFQQPDMRGGSEVTLNWALQGIIQELTLTPADAELSVDDVSAVVRPVANTNYILTASNGAGSVQAQVDVEVLLTEISSVNFFDQRLDECFQEMVAELGIQYVEEVQALDCSSRQILEVGGIEELINLESLDLSDNLINRLYGVSFLRYLREVNLNNNLLEEVLTFVDPMVSQLQSLKVGNNPLRDIDGLLEWVSTQTALEALDLSGLPLLLRFRSQPVALPDSLRYLNLTATGIDRLPLLPLGLRELHAGSNRLNDVYGVDQAFALTHLDLSDNLITSLWLLNLNSLNQLKFLDLSGNGGIELDQVVSALDDLPELEHLGLGGICLNQGLAELGTFMTEPDPLQPSKLKSMNLENTCIRQINELANHPLLEEVNLANNRIEYLGLSLDWENLKAIDVSHTRLDNINELFLSAGLERLGLNGLTHISLQEITQLVQQNASTLTHLSLAALGARQVTTDSSGPGAGDSIFLPLSSDLIEYLDVSNNHLAMLDLSNYPNIRYIDVSNNTGLAGQLFFESPSFIESINISNTLLTNLGFYLEYPSKLRDLKAINVPDILREELGYSIGGLALLRSLHLSDVVDVDRFGLGELQKQNLRELHVPGINLDRQGYLGEYEQLESLDIAGGIQADLGLIAQVDLKKLVARDAGLRSPEGLQDFEYLRYLDLSGNDQMLGWDFTREITENLNHLTYLNLSDIPFPSIWYINNFDFDDCDRWRQLQTLIVDNAQLNEIPSNCFESIRHVSLRNNNMELDFYAYTAALRYLDLSGNELRDFFVNSMWQLEHLDISHNPAVQTFDVQAFLNSNPQLTGLGIGGRYQGLQGISFNPTHHQRMKFLDLSDMGLEVMPGDLIQMEALETLNLSANRLIDFYVWTPQLQSLDLSNNPLALVQFDTSSVVGGLRALNVSNTRLNRNSQFENWLTAYGANLRHLSVSGLEFDNTFILNSFAPAPLPNIYPLQSLEIAGTNLELGDLSQFPQLKELNISGLSSPTFITEEVMVNLTSLVANNIEVALGGANSDELALKELSLNNAVFDASWLDILFMRAPKLSRIALAGINRDIDELGLFVEPSRWRSFDLSNTGWQAVNELENQYGLSELILKGNGIESLQWVSQLEGLETLDLSDNNISQLPELARSPNLINLNLSGNTMEVTQEFIDFVDGSFLEELRLSGLTMAPGSNWGFAPNNRLRILDLSNVVVGDDLPIPLLDRIEELYLNNTGIINLQLPINSYSRISTLELNDNNLINFSIPFGENLTTLKVARNPLIDINALLQSEVMTDRLEVLDVSGYSSLNSLGFFQNPAIALRDFAMADTQVSSLGALFDAPDLQRLDVTNAPVDCVEIEILQQTKPELELIGGQGCSNPTP